MPKSPQRPQGLGKRAYADDGGSHNPSKNKKSKMNDNESDIPVQQAFKLITQLTMLEQKVEESRAEFEKFKDTCIKDQELKNANFAAEIQKIKSIIDKQIIENLG